MDRSSVAPVSPGHSEAIVNAFRHNLGPFVVAAEKTRMPMVFSGTDAPHSLVFVNDAFLTLTGYDRDEILGAGFKSLLSDAASEESIARMEACLRNECDEDLSVNLRRKDGGDFWASMFVSPVCDADGTLAQQFVSFVDLTSHREDNARCKMLVDELNHRVKNTLSTVQSIVAQALRRPGDPAAIGEAIESRILALSRSHDLLSRRTWKGAGLHDIVDIALHPFEAVADHRQRFTVTGDNVQLSSAITLSLAIAFHEMATNAVKYGALSNDAGKVVIEWSKSTGDKVVLKWSEYDGPLVTPPARRGFGSWVIERGLAHELGTEVSLEYRREGVVVTIEIPLRADPCA